MTLHNRHKFYGLVLAVAVGSASAYADLLDDGRAAFFDYDFDTASELYAKYAQILKKKPNQEGLQLLDDYMRQLEIAGNALDNVQKIEIIDRLDVPANDFFKVISLPRNGGRLLSPDQVPEGVSGNDSDFVYSSESSDFLMWTETDDQGVSHMVESERLLDGTWEKPLRSGEVLNGGGNVRNPFMLSDGVTLYFSGDGEDSMGGYDLFVATRDASTGEFRQPIGVGFPFNSPYNEYMMAIDEENGIGWWVTDRNGLDEQVSVYVFKTNDVRKNYVADEVEDIVALARLDDISITQDPSVDYADFLAKVEKGNATEQAKAKEEFLFPLPGGKVLTRLSDLPSSQRRVMRAYLKAEKEYNDHVGKLSGLRRKYHAESNGKGASQTLVHGIKDLEKQLEAEKENLKKMRNSVITEVSGI